MKSKRVQGWLAVMVLATSLWSGSPAKAETIGQEELLNPDTPTPSEAGIDLSRDYVVWTNEEDTTFGIMMYDRAEEKAQPVLANGHEKTNLKTDGNYIAWIDKRHTNREVYLYDIKAKTEKRITTGAQPSELEMDGSRLVWIDKRSAQAEVHVYDITTGQEKTITTTGKASLPVVYGQYVAWQDERNGNADIYMYDLIARTETQVTSHASMQAHPSIYNGVIVYEEHRYENQASVEISRYIISSKREERLTNDTNDQRVPKLYDDTIIFQVGKDLEVLDLDDRKSKELKSSINRRIAPAIYGSTVVYTQVDADDKTNLYTQSIRDGETEQIGQTIIEPSQPAASDHYIVYINNRNRHEEVVLLDLASRQAKVISSEGEGPVRPLVSNKWVVYYDYDEERIVAYHIPTGKRQIVTTDDDRAAQDLYELSEERLVWVSDQSRDDIICITDLATGKTDEVRDVRRLPYSVDLRGDMLAYITEESNGKGKLYLYDLKQKDEIYISKEMETENVQLSDKFAVWDQRNEDTEGWDIFFYSYEDEKALSLFRKREGDQTKPQASGDMIIFQDKLPSDSADEFGYQMYDLVHDDYVYSMSNDAVPSDLQMGGNRIVWLDKRDRLSDDPLLYMMAFAQPAPRDDDDKPTDPNDGIYTEYVFLDVINDDRFVNLLQEYGMENVMLVFYANTDQEKNFTMLEVANEKFDEVMKLLNEVPMEEVLLRTYE